MVHLHCSSVNFLLFYEIYEIKILKKKKKISVCCWLIARGAVSTLYSILNHGHDWCVCLPVWGSRSLPDNFFPQRKRTPRRKARDPTSTLPKCPRCEKSKIRKVVDTKFPGYDHYAIRNVRDAKPPRYNKSHTRKLPDCTEIENSVECVVYKLHCRDSYIQFSLVRSVSRWSGQDELQCSTLLNLTVSKQRPYFILA